MSQEATAKTNVSSTDPDNGYCAYSAFELMLIELIPMSHRISAETYIPDPSQISTPTTTTTASSAPTAVRPLPPDFTDKHHAITTHRLSGLGYRVGLGLVESLLAAHPRPSPTEPLDTIKLLCKDIWIAVFRKQIDNLKTNHRGVFVLTDNSFAPLRRMSLAAGGGGGSGAAAAAGGNTSSKAGVAEDGATAVVAKGGQARAAATAATVAAAAGGADEVKRRVEVEGWLSWPEGLVRGTLSALGIETTVTAEVGPGGVPGVVFLVSVVGGG